jgi:hypothetical protein
MKRIRTSLFYVVVWGILALCGAALADVVGIEITGPNEVAENFRASYKAIAYCDNNGAISTMDVTNLALWVVEPNTAANIDENGVLTTKYIVKEQSTTILACYTEGEAAFNAEKTINIFPTCPTGTALSFDGIDDYVSCGNSESLDVSSEFTFSTWFKANTLPTRSTGAKWFIGKDIYGKRSYDFGLWKIAGGGVRLVAQINGLNMPANGANTNIETKTWYHAVVTYDGSKVAYYLYGSFDGTAPGIDAQVTDETLYIGRRGYIGFEEHFDGIIDEVRIYNRALPAEEISATMHKRLNGDEPGLVGYWDFDEGGGQIVYDLTGNGNDGQLGVSVNVDDSDPTWIKSDAPIGICTPYLSATMAAERIIEHKFVMIEELLATLVQESAVCEVLEELLESGDYGDMYKGDIVTAKQKIHSATQHEEQSIDALEKSLEKLKDALRALDYESVPPLPVPNQQPTPAPSQ